jgi:hypothetical protein
MKKKKEKKRKEKYLIDKSCFRGGACDAVNRKVKKKKNFTTIALVFHLLFY